MHYIPHTHQLYLQLDKWIRKAANWYEKADYGIRGFSANSWEMYRSYAVAVQPLLNQSEREIGDQPPIDSHPP